MHRQSSSQFSGNDNAIDCNDAYYLSCNDHSRDQLGQILFTGSNYTIWNRSVSLALGAKNKLGFIDGSLPCPPDHSPDVQKWKLNDFMVTGWLLNSMDKGIAEGLLFAPSARDLWIEIQERYGHSNNLELYELHRNLISITQKYDSIADYYKKLKKIWDQLHVVDPFPDCTCGSMVNCNCGLLKKLEEADQLKKLFHFIAGLNSSYDDAKIKILSLDPVPSVNKAYHMLQDIERQNFVINSHSVEMSALFSAGQGPRYASKLPSDQKTDASSRNKLDRFCLNCKMRGHIKEDCFKIIGYPDWYKGNTGNSFRTSEQRFAEIVQGNTQDVSGNLISESPSCSATSGNFTMGGSQNNALRKEFLSLMQANQGAGTMAAKDGKGLASGLVKENRKEVSVSNDWIATFGLVKRVAFGIASIPGYIWRNLGFGTARTEMRQTGKDTSNFEIPDLNVGVQ